MTERTAPHIADRLAAVLSSFERDGDAALAPLALLYDHDVVFRDPLQTLTGRDAFLAMNQRVISRARRVRFEVTDTATSANAIFLSWRMTYVPRRGSEIVFEGATHARVRGSKIVEQRDYWDLLSSVAQSLPILRPLYTALAPKLG